MKRRKFDREFKQMAVELSKARDDIQAVAKELDIGADLIYRWRKEAEEHPEDSFPGQGNQLLSEEQKRIMKLEKELKDTQLERDILKKAIGIFSKNDGKYSNS
jgi:transposase